MLAPSAALLRLLARSLSSLPRSWESEFLMSQNDLVLSHSASTTDDERTEAGATASIDADGQDDFTTSDGPVKSSLWQLLETMRQEYVIVWMIDNDFREGGENLWKAIEETISMEKEGEKQ